MSASSDSPLVDRPPPARGRSDEHPPQGSTSSHKRLTAQHPATNGAVSPSLRRALGEAATRSALVLAETAGKTAEEIQSQLEAIIELMPELDAGSQTEVVEDARCNVPRRYVDVLRSE